MKFEELLKSLEESNTEELIAAATIDFGVRLSVITAALALSKEQLKGALEASEEQTVSQFDAYDDATVKEIKRYIDNIKTACLEANQKQHEA